MNASPEGSHRARLFTAVYRPGEKSLPPNVDLPPYGPTAGV